MQQSVELLWVYNNLIGNRIWIANSMLGVFLLLCVCMCCTTLILYEEYSRNTNSPITITFYFAWQTSVFVAILVKKIFRESYTRDKVISGWYYSKSNVKVSDLPKGIFVKKFLLVKEI